MTDVNLSACFDVSAQLGFKLHKEPKSIMLEKVNEENINNVVFHPEDDNSSVVDFNAETSTFREMLNKKKVFFRSS